jgi:hypothetical protein
MMRNHWVPASEADLVRAIAEGVFEEHHHFEVKREIGDTPGKRKDRARDLAGLAVDGGILLVGVEENKDERTWARVPQPLKGLGERIEQIAANAIDPPLPVRARDLPSTDDPALGYVVVEVPASVHAPHMVDGVYWGRGEKTRQRLSDAEVRRFHAAQSDLEEHVHTLLDAEIDRDPLPLTDRGTGHLYLVAHPVRAGRHAARDLVRHRQNTLQEFIETTELPPSEQWEPSPHQARTGAVRADGYAFCTPPMADRRSIEYSTENLAEVLSAEIEFREDAGIRVFLGGLVREVEYTRTGAETVIADRLAGDYLHGLFYWASRVAEGIEYRGPWAIGLAANGLKDSPSSMAVAHPRRRYHRIRYERDTYRATTIATFTDLQERRRYLADQLLGSLAYALNSHDLMPEYLNQEHTG